MNTASFGTHFWQRFEPEICDMLNVYHPCWSSSLIVIILLSVGIEI
jgi:hypothetical protein